MAERTTAHTPTAPPAAAMSPTRGMMLSFGSAREGTALHIQQLAHEQRELSSQLEEITARLIGVNQQLADSVAFGQWVSGNGQASSAAVSTPSPETEKLRQVGDYSNLNRKRTM